MEIVSVRARVVVIIVRARPGSIGIHLARNGRRPRRPRRRRESLPGAKSVDAAAGSDLWRVDGKTNSAVMFSLSISTFGPSFAGHQMEQLHCAVRECVRLCLRAPEAQLLRSSDGAAAADVDDDIDPGRARARSQQSPSGRPRWAPRQPRAARRAFEGKLRVPRRASADKQALAAVAASARNSPRASLQKSTGSCRLPIWRRQLERADHWLIQSTAFAFALALALATISRPRKRPEQSGQRALGRFEPSRANLSAKKAPLQINQRESRQLSRNGPRRNETNE